MCVRFGMVTADTDVEELLSLVTSIGKNVEESSKDLENMVEIVKKGQVISLNFSLCIIPFFSWMKQKLN